jgi:hypothetical protein
LQHGSLNQEDFPHNFQTNAPKTPAVSIKIGNERAKNSEIEKTSQIPNRYNDYLTDSAKTNR